MFCPTDTQERPGAGQVPLLISSLHGTVSFETGDHSKAWASVRSLDCVVSPSGGWQLEKENQNHFDSETISIFDLIFADLSLF